MSLSTRLFVLGGFTLLPVVAVQLYNEFDSRRDREAEIRSGLVGRARQIGAEQQRLFDGIRNVLHTLAELREVRTRDAAACSALFGQLAQAFPGIVALAATGKDGDIFCSSTRPTLPAPAPNVAGRYYFQQTMATGRFTIGHYAFGRYTDMHVLHLAVPYHGETGQIAGVVFASLSLDWLAAQLDGLEWNQDRAFSIVDNAGTVLIRQPNHAHFVGKPFPAELWKIAREATQAGTYEINSPLDGVRRIVGFVPPSASSSGLYVGIGESRAAAFGNLDEATLRGALGIAAGVLFAMGLAWLFGTRLIRRPMARLIATTDRWRKGDLSARSGMQGPTEIGQLAQAFDALADDLVAALHHKDVLLRELSHRVMNSLQTIASMFSLQGRNVSDPQAKAQFEQAVERIRAVALTYRRMHAAGGVESIDFAEFVRELCDDLARSLLADTGQCSVEVDPLIVGASQAMPLALVVNELVTNALKHGDADNAQLTVKLGHSSEGWRLAVRNRGTLPPGYRPDAHHGFGMKMVLAMVKELGGRLEAASMAGETEFAVTFTPKMPQPTILSVVAARA